MTSMRLQVLGPGCARCKALMQSVQAAVEQSGLDAQIEKVEDIPSIMKFGVMSTPALVVDGKVVTQGKVPSAEEVKRMISGVV